MARIVIAVRVDHDLERILEHLLMHDAADPAGRIEDIIAALDVLATNPWIGRAAEEGRRELVIGRDRQGYLALYAYDPHSDEAVVLAIRAQKESGYHRS
jgi:toxin ParE1/3/4